MVKGQDVNKGCRGGPVVYGLIDSLGCTLYCANSLVYLFGIDKNRRLSPKLQLPLLFSLQSL